MLTKEDLIMEIEQQGNVSYKEAEVVVNICFNSIICALYNNERVEIRMFGSFFNRNYRSYQGKNPKSKTVTKVAAKKVTFFKVGKELKELVNLGKNRYPIQNGNFRTKASNQ